MLDASAAVKLAVEEPDSAVVRGMVGATPVVAPELVLSEVADALWRKVRVGAIGAAEARVAQANLPGLFARLAPLRTLQDQALDLALRRDHPAYDCFYVALAMREAAPLLTADRRLAQRFGGDVEVRLPTA
ncbi:type II toxin-antitoxin system VapC family toxin [Craurococcus roseus]|uniref:type II toxin-antitoxin system VapC family toxin n=1 Tax=Craurococcus roseus TaxID=77585 RepID=UPI0031D61AFE